METIYKEKPDRSGRTIALVLTLFAVVSCAVIYYLAVHMQRYIANNPQKLDLYYRNTQRFTQEEKLKFLADHAGLWEYTSEVNAGGLPLARSDLLEIKNNGIIWQVAEWDVAMPGRAGPAATRLIQVRTAYVVPYGALGNDTLSDAYTIHQIFIRGNDTCFGGWNFLDLWNMAKSGDSLVLNRKKYARYRGEPTAFFPKGLVDLVGAGASPDNPYFKRNGDNEINSEIQLTARVSGIRDSGAKAAQANALSMPSCQDLTSLGEVLKEELARAFKPGALILRSPEAVDSLLDRYYQPLLIEEHFRNFPRPLPREATASFSVNLDGSLDHIQISGPQEIDKMLANEMIHEIGAWRLPPAEKPLAVRHTFSMP
jgi:hypothetical protein